MNSEIFPLPALAKELESCQGSQFQLLLTQLTSPEYIDEQLVKSELALVVTKIIKLLRSNADYDVWKGCHVAVVLCSYNPLVLCCHGGQLLTVIYSKLEQKVEYHSSSCQTICGRIVLNSLVFATSNIVELMRNKPTLSREHLVPKLKAIIPCLIRLTPSEPGLCLPVLKRLLFKHSTTFRPFANKYRQVLGDLITKEYAELDRKTQVLVCENYAYLHLIKLQASTGQDYSQAHHKPFEDETWRVGILSILAQFKPVLELCDEFLELDHDQDLKNLIKNLNYDRFYHKDMPTIDKRLPGLKLDLNEPVTLWQIPQRLHLLVDLLCPFLTLATPYPVRLPLNAFQCVFEALLSLTKNVLPLKREIRRDSELVSVISDILPRTQFAGITLMTVMVNSFGKCCLSMLPSILGSLEYFIPFQQKSKNIDIKRCKKLKSEFLQFFQLLNACFPHMGHQLQDVDFFNRLIEVALALSEEINPVHLLTNRQPNNVQSSKNGSHKKQKKDGSVGALSDMYTHSEQFVINTPYAWHDEINLFFRGLLSNWKLPPSQQVKIIRYSISSALKFKQEFGYIPASFVQLLRTEVVHPGNERVSILPIAISLLKDSCDDVFDLLCHPRLPMSMIHHVNKPGSAIEEETNAKELKLETDSESDGNAEEIRAQEQHSKDIASDVKDNLKRENPQPARELPKRQKLDKDIPMFQVQKTEVTEADRVAPPSPSSAKEMEMKVEETTAEETKIEQFHSGTADVHENKEEVESDSDSDFVIPTIDISDDD